MRWKNKSRARTNTTRNQDVDTSPFFLIRQQAPRKHARSVGQPGLASPTIFQGILHHLPRPFLSLSIFAPPPPLANSRRHGPDNDQLRCLERIFFREGGRWRSAEGRARRRRIAINVSIPTSKQSVRPPSHLPSLLYARIRPAHSSQTQEVLLLNQPKENKIKHTHTHTRAHTYNTQTHTRKEYGAKYNTAAHETEITISPRSYSRKHAAFLYSREESSFPTFEYCTAWTRVIFLQTPPLRVRPVALYDTTTTEGTTTGDPLFSKGGGGGGRSSTLKHPRTSLFTKLIHQGRAYARIPHPSNISYFTNHGSVG